MKFYRPGKVEEVLHVPPADTYLYTTQYLKCALEIRIRTQSRLEFEY